jgi:Fe-S cluster assembly protein SufD
MINIRNFSNDNIILLDDTEKSTLVNIRENEKKIVLLTIMDGESIEKDFILNINGKNAEVIVLVMIIAFGNQVIKIRTKQMHNAGNSKSMLFVRSVLFGKSYFDYEGLITIFQKAGKSDAYLKNQNIIMSDCARVTTKPNLQIKTNDVCCKHGASTGKIDKNGLFYLSTRGITQSDAEKLILEGFMTSDLDKIPDNKIKYKLKKDIRINLSRMYN